MPLIHSAEGAFFTQPGSEEAARLDSRWRQGEFGAKVIGCLCTTAGNQPANLYVPAGMDARIVGDLLAFEQNPPANAYLANSVLRYPEDYDPVMEEAEAYLDGVIDEATYFKNVGKRAVKFVNNLIAQMRQR